MTLPALQLYDTAGRARRAFAPLEPDHVRLYVCGPTVYDFAHIGNARPYTVFDVLVRTLERRFARVTYVRNITDIDDKIIERARTAGVPIETITRRFEAQFEADMAALGNRAPTVSARATEHIPQMLHVIERLLARGVAYTAQGHVLFHVPAMPDYGRLSGRSRDELIAGARVDVAPYKRDPADFVLWKPSAADQPGWDSPWGRGRPGWHLECSAMAEAHLGLPFDIHGGGIDLVFPHHENEIAQSCCATGHDEMASFWMHNGFLMVEGQKMSKSLGNFWTIQQVLDEWPGEAVRLALLMTHYRQPIDFSRARLAEAKAILDRLYGRLRSTASEPSAAILPVASVVEDALADDLNTPAAIQALGGLDGAELRGAGAALGLLRQSAAAWFRWVPPSGAAEPGLDDSAIEALIQARAAARRECRFAEADRLRAQLAEAGIVLEDTAAGTLWRRG